MTAAAPAEIEDAADAGTTESTDVVTPPMVAVLSAFNTSVCVGWFGGRMLEVIRDVALGFVRSPNPLSRSAWRMIGNISLNTSIIGFTLCSSLGRKYGTFCMTEGGREVN